MGRLDIFLPPLPLHLHLEPRLFAEVNAAECWCPREPPRARETPTASHILRMKTFTTILARATPPTPSFPSRGQRPMMSLFLRVLPLPFFLIPPLSFPYFIRGNFVVFSFFFSISNERVVSKFALFLQRGKKGIFGIVEFGTDRNERSLFRYAYSGRIYHFFVPFGSFRISISKRYNKEGEKDEEKENAVKMIRRYDEEKWRSNESFFKILENKNKRIKSVLMNILLPSFENPGTNLRNLAGISEKLLKRKWTWNRN